MMEESDSEMNPLEEIEKMARNGWSVTITCAQQRPQSDILVYTARVESPHQGCVWQTPERYRSYSLENAVKDALFWYRSFAAKS